MDRARRAWSAPSRARAARIAEPYCSRVLIQKGSARAARSICTPASSARISIPRRDLNACNRSLNGFLARTSGTIARFTNFAPRSKRIRRLQRLRRARRPHRNALHVPAMRGRHSRTCLKNSPRLESPLENSTPPETHSSAQFATHVWNCYCGSGHVSRDPTAKRPLQIISGKVES